MAPELTTRAIACFAITQKEEGVGLPTNPWGDTHDDGGDTRAGVTQATFTDWLTRTGGDVGRSVFTATLDELNAIYGEYWANAYCGQLPIPLDLAHFDFTFNSTPDLDQETHVTEAVKVLQRALGVADDGELGPVTLSAAEQADGRDAAEAQLQARLAFYRALVTTNESKYAIYLHSWERRVSHIAAACSVQDPTA